MKNLLFFLNTRDFRTYHRREEIIEYAKALELVGTKTLVLLQPQIILQSIFKTVDKEKSKSANCQYPFLTVRSLWSLLPLSIAEKSRFLMWLFVYLPICWQLREFLATKSCSWFYRPEQLGYVPRKTTRVFLQYDHYAADGNSNEGDKMQRVIEHCVSSSSFSLISSFRLYEEYSTRHQNCVHYPNAISEGLIQRASNHLEERQQNESIKIGFVGNMDQSFDSQFVTQVVNANPDKTFVFVGPQNTAGLTSLAALPNVMMVGRVDYSELSTYISEFDACLCPYKQDRFSQYRNPLKVYEYLAHNKPVVTTPCDLSPDVKSRVEIVSTVEQCNRILNEDTFYLAPLSKDGLQRFHKENSWKARVKLFFKLIEGERSL